MINKIRIFKCLMKRKENYEDMKANYYSEHTVNNVGDNKDSLIIF